LARFLTKLHHCPIVGRFFPALLAWYTGSSRLRRPDFFGTFLITRPMWFIGYFNYQEGMLTGKLAQYVFFGVFPLTCFDSISLVAADLLN